MAGTGFAIRGRGKRLPEVLTQPELAGLVRQANRRAPSGCRNRALLLVLGQCGLRIAEALALRSQDVTLRSPAQRAAGEGQDLVHVWRGKGSKDRTVPATLEVAEAIEEWLAMRRELGIRVETLFCTITERSSGVATGLVQGPVSCATEPGAVLQQSYVRQVVARYAQRAGIPRRVTPHTLRHTAATHWHEQGFTGREVQELLGHSSLVTVQVYTHVSPVELARKMGGLRGLGEV